MNVQVIADPAGRLVWASPTLPGPATTRSASRAGGNGCARPNYPGVYSQVSTFAPAIQAAANSLTPNPCREASCIALGGAYISHYTGADCTGTESYYTPYFGSDGIRRSWDGAGTAGTVLRIVTNRSWRGTDMACHNDWPAAATRSAGS